MQSEHEKAKGNKGQNLALIGGVIGIIVVAVLLLVSNIMYASIYAGLSPTPSNYSALSAAQQATYNLNQNISANTASAFQLSASVPLVLGAALILTVILGFAAVVSRQ